MTRVRIGPRSWLRRLFDRMRGEPELVIRCTRCDNPIARDARSMREMGRRQPAGFLACHGFFRRDVGPHGQVIEWTCMILTHGGRTP